MRAIFSRKVLSLTSSQILKQRPTLSPYPTQTRPFLSPYGFFAPKLHGFCATTLRNANLKVKLESRAGFFGSSLVRPGSEKGFTGFQKRGWKTWFNGANGVVLGLVLVNVGVFTMWKVLDTRWMAKNFMLTVYSFTTGRIHTLITSGFSNYTLSQIIINMTGLCYFGTRIAKTLGPQYLLKLYFAGTLGSSVVFLSHQVLMTTTFKAILPWDDKKEKRNTRPIIQGRGVVTQNLRKPHTLNLGAEGSVFAIALLDIFLFPKVTTYFELMLRVPVMWGIILLGTDMLKMAEGKSISFSENLLAGSLVAVTAWSRIRKGRFHL